MGWWRESALDPGLGLLLLPVFLCLQGLGLPASPFSAPQETREGDTASTKTSEASGGGLWVALLLGKPSPDAGLAAPGEQAVRPGSGFQSHLLGR